MSRIISPINTSDTFQVWLQRTNDLVSELGTSVVTASALGDSTVGNATLLGSFTANTVVVGSTLRTGIIDTLVGNTSPLDIRAQTLFSSISQLPIIIDNSTGPRIKIKNNNVSWLMGLRGSAGSGTDAQFVIGVEGSDFAFRIGTDGTIYANNIILDSDSSSPTGVVRANRTINTTDGITGGGNFTADRTFSLTGQALALHNLNSNGIFVRTGSGTVEARTITAGTGIVVTNGNGVTGNPTITLSTSTQAEAEAGTNNTKAMTPLRTLQAIIAARDGGAVQAGSTILSSITGLSTNGIITRTNTGVCEARTITAGTGINVTNGDGVAGNPTIALSIATQSEAEVGTNSTKAMTPLRTVQAIKSNFNVSDSAPMFACRAWVNFNGTVANGTYTRTGNIVTVTITSHGLVTGNVVPLIFTSGSATSGNYAVTVTGVNTFTVVDVSSGSTSGTVTRNVYVRGSGNVSSVIRNGVGDYTINFAVEMPDTNYSMISIPSRARTDRWGWVYHCQINDPAQMLKSSVRIMGGYVSGTNDGNYHSSSDLPIVSVAVFR